MPIIHVGEYNKTLKRTIHRVYNTDASTFICSVPNGRLFKKPRKCNFFIYNPRGKTNSEQIREVPYLEAKELIKTHGTREQYCKYFSILNADGSYKKKGGTRINIDEFHRVKLFRNASLLGMDMSEFVEYLIDKYDNMGQYNKSYSTHKRKGCPLPNDLSEFTS